MFSHPRYCNGSLVATDVEVYRYALAQCKRALRMTKDLGGLGFVFWGGRVGYVDPLVFHFRHAEAQVQRFFEAMLEYKEEIGFDGEFFIEPKAKEPTTHQLDFDAATVLGFLDRHNLREHFSLNIEPNHTQLAGHHPAHDLLVAVAHDALGSVDVNQGEASVGWDSDDFLWDPTFGFYIAWATLLNGPLCGGYNVDAKPRRPSFAIADWVQGHISTVDTMTIGFRAAAYLFRQGKYQELLNNVAMSWDEDTTASRFMSHSVSANSMTEGMTAVALPCQSSGIERARTLIAQAIVVAGGQPA